MYILIYIFHLALQEFQVTGIELVIPQMLANRAPPATVGFFPTPSSSN